MKSRKKFIDPNGLQIRLYAIFLFFIASIICIIALLQSVYFTKSMRADLEYNMQETAHNISATYATAGYMSTIRSVINSGDYRIRTMTEDGTILVDTNDLSVYIQWPDISYDIEEIRSRLNHSDGYFYMQRTDSDNVEWEVYVQVVALQEEQREILMVAQSTQNLKLQIRRQTLFLLKIAAGILVAGFIFSWFLAKNYLRPIRDITSRAAELSKGDYSVTFPRGSYTEIDTLSEVLDQSVEQMANYEQIRRDMISNVSHDMRTPLTMIKAYAEMIQTISGDNPEKRNEHLNVIISQADKLSEFVNSTLDLNRLISKQVILNESTFPLDQLVANLITHMQIVDNGEHIFHLTLDRNCIVHADFGRIEQIVYNLVNNAMKYGDGTIDICVTRKNGKIRLEIMDFGEGIPEDKVHLIWDRYYRVNPFDKGSGSTGVGLSIVKEIAELHHLEYGLESSTGCGAHFWFDFPEVS